MTFLYKNNAVSRAAAAIAASDTIVTVLSGEGAKFPLPAGGGDFFMVTFDDRRNGTVEICKCTARTGDNLTVVRAQEGTTAQAFAKDTTIANRFTAASIDYILLGVGYDKPTTDATFVHKVGDTMTGDLIVPAPGAGGAAANKTYVDGQVATKIGDAPLDTSTYGRSNGAWVTVVNSLTYTAADVLAKLVTVDGTGSGLDADLLDGHDTAFFAPQTALDAANVNITNNTSNISALQTTVGTHTTQISGLQTSKLDVTAYTAADVLTKIKSVDGAGSGLDADTLDGYDSSVFVTTAILGAYAPLASPAFTGNPTAPTPTAGDNDTSIATTAFVTAAVATREPTLAAGTSAQYYRGDKTWQTLDKTAVGLANVDNTSDVNKPVSTATQTALNAKLNLSGGTMTGAIVLPADPTTALQAATKQYVDAKPAGAVISDTPPASPSQGQTWWESDTGNFYISFNDGNSTQWVQINGPAAGSGIGDAPYDGNFYGRQSAAWVQSYTKASVDTLLAAKAPLASPALTGTPTAPTAAAGTNNTQVATTAYADRKFSSITIRNFSNTSGTWTPAFANCLGIDVEIWGSGGGGGGCASTGASQGSAGGGGGSGGYLRKYYPGPFTSYAYVAGDGGAGGGAGATGSTGAQSNFGPSLVVTGGVGGAGMAAVSAAGTNSYGGAGGSGSGGDMNTTGQYGENGLAIPFALNVSIGARGAHGMIGNGSLALVGNSAGNPGTPYQAGGGGGCNGQSQGAAKAGGKGAPALIIVTEYY